jgi:hypothetical protein
VDVILGLVILFVSGAALWSRKWAARRRISEAIEGDGMGGDAARADPMQGEREAMSREMSR